MATVRGLFLERWIFKSRSLNCLGTELDSVRTLQANSTPLGSSNLSENIIVWDGISGFLVAFLNHDSDTARTLGLAKCDEAVNKTNLHHQRNRGGVE